MRVVIAGGHGQIALRLSKLLAGRGDEPVGLIRNPDHVADVTAAGARPVLADLENVDAPALAEHLTGADAVVFAAGAGPGSGAARKDTVDRGGAVVLADAALAAGVRRYLLVSSMGLDHVGAPGVDTVFSAYLVAKQAAEDAVLARDLDTTVLRPGRLTNDPGTGLVRLDPPPIDPGAVSRDDVAAVLAALLTVEAPGTFELVSGDTPIDRAVRLIAQK